jgi:hypothetical protein
MGMSSRGPARASDGLVKMAGLEGIWRLHSSAWRR